MRHNQTSMAPLNISSRNSSAGSSYYAESDVSGGSAARSAMRDRAKRWIATSARNQQPHGTSSSFHLDGNNWPNRENTQPADNNNINHSSNLIVKHSAAAVFGDRAHVERRGVTMRPSVNTNDERCNKFASKSSTAELTDAAIESSLQAWDEIAHDDAAPHYEVPESTPFDIAIKIARLRRGNIRNNNNSNTGNANMTKESYASRSFLSSTNASKAQPSTSNGGPAAINKGAITNNNSASFASNHGRISKIAERFVSRGRTPSPAFPSDEGGDSANDLSPTKQNISPLSFSPATFHASSFSWHGDENRRIRSSLSINEEIDNEVATWIDRDSDAASSSDSSEVNVLVNNNNNKSASEASLLLRETVATIAQSKQNTANITNQQQPKSQQQRTDTGIRSTTMSPPINIKSAFVNGNLASKQTNGETVKPRHKKSFASEKYQQAIAMSKSPVITTSQPLKPPSSHAETATVLNQPWHISESMTPVTLTTAQLPQSQSSAQDSALDFTAEKVHVTITHRPSPVRPVLHVLPTDMSQYIHKKEDSAADVAPKTKVKPAGESEEAVWKIDRIFPHGQKKGVKNASSTLPRQSLLSNRHGPSAFGTPKKIFETEKVSHDALSIPDGIDLSASAQRYYASTGRNLEAFDSPPLICRTSGVKDCSTGVAKPQPLSEDALLLQNLYSPMRRPVNGVAVPGYEGFINKTADLPNLMDQCSVVSGATDVLEETRIASTWIQTISDTNSMHSNSSQSCTDLSQYYIDPDVARQLVQKYRKMCQRKHTKRDEDHKKAFALFEMRSRIMETDIERGLPRQGGTSHTDDIVLTSSNLAAIRVRDTAIVSKAWRDGASPRDLVTASLLTRKSTHTYFIKRPLYENDGFAGDESLVGHFFEEVRWLDDSYLSQIRCASLELMPVRGFDIFTLGDCHSLLLKLTNERCIQLHDELEAAYEVQLDAEQEMELEGRSGYNEKAIMTDVEMTYLTSLQDISEISVKLEQAEKAFRMVQGGISKLIAKYEALLVVMNQSGSFDSDTEDEEETLAVRAKEAERKAKAAEKDALKAKKEAERIRNIKDSEVQSLKTRVEELERQTVIERVRSQDIFKQYELKIENLEKQSAIGLESRSMFQHSVCSSQGPEKVESVKKKFRSRHVERLNKNPPSVRSSPAETRGNVKKLSAQFERSSTDKQSSTSSLRMSEEEMFQHLDFYERIAKGKSLTHI